MRIPNHPGGALIAVCCLAALVFPCEAARKKVTIANPDFLKGDPKYLPLVKKEAEWASGYSTDAMATWYYGYVIMLLAEYEMATGDESLMPGLRRLALEAANGQSIVGSWGHRFAGPDGRLVGYGMMNAPGVPLTISLAMARAAGVDDPKVSEAIERSARLLRFYAGKGCVPYGDHSPWMQTHDDNGKNGMAAVLFNLIDEPEKAEFFSRMSVASHGAERDEGHTGNFCKEIKPLLPGILRAVVEPAPSGIMFADGIRMAGLHLLVKHRVPEGVDASVGWLRAQNHWHSANRTPEIMKILIEYGTAAKPAISELKKLADSLAPDGEHYLVEGFPKQAASIRSAILEALPAIEAL